MIYATDLDRTLIFSERMLKEFPSNLELVAVETDGAKVISYASSVSLYMLGKLRNKGVQIIPVTSRSIAEFERINLNTNFKYAIMSNGGTITINGDKLKDWDRITDTIVQSLDFESVINAINNLESVNYNTRVIDGKYIFSRTDDAERCACELEDLRLRYPKLDIVLLKTKIYVSAKEINKGTAIKFLKDYIGEGGALISAGDGEPDIEMMKVSDISISPMHGDIVQESLYAPTYIVSPGVESAVEALNLIETML